MLVFILILLLVAAIFGILGAVLKAVVFLVITALLTITVLGAIAWWGIRRSARKFSAEYTRQMNEHAAYRENEAGRQPLPPHHDDRY